MKERMRGILLDTVTTITIKKTCANCRRWKVDAKDAKDRNIFLKAVEDGRIKGSTYLKLEGECTGLRMHVLSECKLVVIENLKLKSDNCEWRLKTTESFVCSEWAEKLTDEDIQRADTQKITFTSHDAMLKAFGIMTQLAPRGVMLCPVCHGYGATVEFDKNDGHLIRQSCSCGYDSSKVTDGKVFAPMGKEDQ